MKKIVCIFGMLLGLAMIAFGIVNLVSKEKKEDSKAFDEIQDSFNTISPSYEQATETSFGGDAYTYIYKGIVKINSNVIQKSKIAEEINKNLVSLGNAEKIMNDNIIALGERIEKADSKNDKEAKKNFNFGMIFAGSFVLLIFAYLLTGDSKNAYVNGNQKSVVTEQKTVAANQKVTVDTNQIKVPAGISQNNNVGKTDFADEGKTWKCIRCGKENKETFSECSCGLTKGESEHIEEQINGYKELLTLGIISEEEFEAKKRSILS